MQNFLFLEGAYIVIAIFILAVTLFVTTRDFMSKDAPKKGLIGVSLVLALMILAHYYFTTKRISQVKIAFEKDLPIICESRATRRVSQSIIIQKSSDWSLVGDDFSSPNYNRKFFIARCIIK